MIENLLELSDETLKELINIYKAEPKKVKSWRNGACYLNALPIVSPLITQCLGHDQWTADSGTYFETWYPYRIHADTAPDINNYQTFVFPLDWTLQEKAKIEENVLYVFNQAWKNETTMFLKGSPQSKQVTRASTETRDYSIIKDLKENYFDESAIIDCDHLDRENFEGLTVKKKLLWKPGHPFTFPRTLLHCSNNWKRIGIYRKLGLSIFTSVGVDSVQSL